VFEIKDAYKAEKKKKTSKINQTVASLPKPLVPQRNGGDLKNFKLEDLGIRITTVYCFLHGDGRSLCSANCIDSGVNSFLTLFRASSCV
jgi:uncharacterized UBP type Zn finger protein